MVVNSNVNSLLNLWVEVRWSLETKASWVHIGDDAKWDFTAWEIGATCASVKFSSHWQEIFISNDLTVSSWLSLWH